MTVTCLMAPATGLELPKLLLNTWLTAAMALNTGGKGAKSDLIGRPDGCARLNWFSSFGWVGRRQTRGGGRGQKGGHTQVLNRGTSGHTVVGLSRGRSTSQFSGMQSR